MPRIEIIPAGWEDSKEKANGDGTPTVDLCKGCARGLAEFDDIKEMGDKMSKQYPGATLGSVDVEHPEYEDDVYLCEDCGHELTNRDN
jgi:hypothetical protein